MSIQSILDVVNVEDVQQWAAYIDLRKTQKCVAYKEKRAEEAETRYQIR